MKAKRILIGIAVLILIIVLVGAILLVPINPKMFSEKRHIKNITKRVIERYGSDESFTVSPLTIVAEKDMDLGYYLIEFEGGGFVIARARKVAFYIFINRGMYQRCDFFDTWQRYRLEECESLDKTNNTY